MDATLNSDRALEADLKDVNTLPDAGASNAPAEIRSTDRAIDSKDFTQFI